MQPVERTSRPTSTTRQVETGRRIEFPSLVGVAARSGRKRCSVRSGRSLPDRAAPPCASDPADSQAFLSGPPDRRPHRGSARALPKVGKSAALLSTAPASNFCETKESGKNSARKVSQHCPAHRAGDVALKAAQDRDDALGAGRKIR